jgi:hypothetical protein
VNSTLAVVAGPWSSHSSSSWKVFPSIELQSRRLYSLVNENTRSITYIPIYTINDRYKIPSPYHTFAIDNTTPPENLLKTEIGNLDWFLPSASSSKRCSVCKSSVYHMCKCISEVKTQQIRYHVHWIVLSIATLSILHITACKEQSVLEEAGL